MNRTVRLTTALCAVSSTAHASALGNAATVPIGQRGGTLDGELMICRWGEGMLKLPAPEDKPVKTLSSRPSLKLSRHGRMDRISKSTITQPALPPCSISRTAAIRWQGGSLTDMTPDLTHDAMVLKR
ncbi:hypothetical protein [uncultured Sulfitobacter sp.]|uniref:hypothetical protein n=1 Tax=uncultured Sulfitobacter sp. TaxID=191468 RepID=UPI00260C5E32|nr:hypothetical protein [uncultured Sulfitobacter sp.]